MKYPRPKLTVRKIMTWADAHHKRTGYWPTKRSGRVYETPDDTWMAIDRALGGGIRGLPGGSSLATELTAARGPRKRRPLRPVTIETVMAWVDAHYERTGRWPTKRSGPVHGVRGESWMAVDASLCHGRRTLPGHMSLARRLARDRNVRNAYTKPDLTIKQVLKWADAHHRRTGKYPVDTSGPVKEAPGETWSGLTQSLHHGGRGLPPSGSLAKLLAKHSRKRNRAQLPRLTYNQVLAWADRHHRRTGNWPTRHSGPVDDSPEDTWGKINYAMKVGYRGFKGNLSLAGLLAARRNVPKPNRGSPLSIEQILGWADHHRRRTGKWPHKESRTILAAPSETWSAVNDALRVGRRGLGSPTTLASLLAQYRGRRHRGDLPRLTIKQILAWIDAFRKRTDQWPSVYSGEIAGSNGETWSAINDALRTGSRGPGPHTSLAKNLATYRNKRHPNAKPRLSISQILDWADRHCRRTGHWPKMDSGPIVGARDLTWSAVHSALMSGSRGLPVGSSLPRLLQQRRNVRNVHGLPPLTRKQILAWADAFHKKHKKWPTPKSGRIPGANGQDWSGVQAALWTGGRGLRTHMTLAQLLAKHRGVRNNMDLPAMTVPKILKWADAYHKRTGKWPKKGDGVIPLSGRETWQKVDANLIDGLRGLRAGSSLPRLLAKHRGVRNIHDLPRLTIKRILAWADDYHRRFDQWPKRATGHIEGTGGETWDTINHALKKGTRGMRAGWSLAKLLNTHRRPQRGL